MGSDRRRFALDLHVGRGPETPEPKELSAERKTLIHRYMTEAEAVDDQVAGAAEEDGVGREIRKSPPQRKPTPTADGAKPKVQVPRPAPEGGGKTRKKPVAKQPAAATAGARGRGSAPRGVNRRAPRTEPVAVGMREPAPLSGPREPTGPASAFGPRASPLAERGQRYFWTHRVDVVLYSVGAAVAVAIGLLISHIG